MFIICYDFRDDRIRNKFSSYLKKYGRKIQYSIFEIKNSRRLLKNILNEIELKYRKEFQNSDSIIIFQVCDRCQKEIVRYGYAKNEDSDVIIFE
ncbi:CRISPR-associated endonuclease Cas2 [bacterium]|nr:CRISPR-associated endonuclease Cas2 [bacterium]